MAFDHLCHSVSHAPKVRPIIISESQVILPIIRAHMTHTDSPIVSRHRVFALFWLVVASCLCVGILTARMLYMQNGSYRFMLWNLFLAWIPVVCALLLERTRGRFAVIVCAATWLLFLPNAPYMLTDVAHVGGRSSNWFWYDLIMFLSFALTGLILGYVSLYIVQKRVAERFGSVRAWVFAILTLGLCSFGIYLGRFERFNSWDVIFNPLDIVIAIWERIRHPFDYPWTYALSFMLAALLVIVYVGLHGFATTLREPTHEPHKPLSVRLLRKGTR
jgi:uncharacterized membrane protein